MALITRIPLVDRLVARVAPLPAGAIPGGGGRPTGGPASVGPLRPLAAISRGRLVRLLLGFALLLAGAAIYTPELLYTTSSEAILNARIITLAAPIEGHIVKGPPPEGTVVASGSLLATIENRNVDIGRLTELEAARTKASAELAASRQLIKTLGDQLAVLDQQMSVYRNASVARLKLATGEAQADAAAAQATAAEAQRNFERKQALRNSGAISPADIDQAQAAALRTAAAAERTRLGEARLAGELDAARRGIYIDDQQNDVPYSQQRADEYSVRKAEAEAQAKGLAAQIAELDPQLVQERARMARLSSAEVRAPVSGVVWRPLVAAGSPVGRDSEMLTLINCSEIYATATLSGRRFDDLRPGGRATVRVLGSDAEYAGTIVDVRAMERSEAEERFAAPLPPLGARQILAIVRIDDPQPLASQKYCNVGRRIEVRFAPVSRQLAPGHVD